ncbi:MAG: leucine-rich repeat domain-containing protein [Bacteroidaceae bacterium]|nr:leucine-rich repeat domain-containing protein [Bacteroidaceae bacterium]
MKNLRTILTAILMLCCTTMSAQDFITNGLYYNILSDDDNTVEVFGAYKSEVVIPANVTYNGVTYSVTAIGDFAFNYSGLTSITIPNSVTTIGQKAFYNCTSLTSIASFIPADKLFAPESDAFYNITTSCTLYVPAEAKETYAATDGWNEFENIVELEGQCGDNAYWAFDEETGILTILGEGAMYDFEGEEASWYVYKDNISNVIIKFGITTIGDNAFYGYTSIASIEIPNSVTNIGYYAFMNCSSLTSARIPNSVNTIERGAFARCGFTNIEIPSSVTSIEEGAFFACSKLASITVDESNSVYDNRNNWNAIIETKSNKLIAASQNTVIPNDVTIIDNYTFGECYNKTSITIPNSVTTIGVHAFNSCINLESIEIPNSVTSIEECAFHGCTSLKSITIGNNVTHIGQHAFAGCKSLTSVTSHIPADKLFTTHQIFINIDLDACTLYVPYGAKETYAATDGWNEFTNIVELEYSGQCGENAFYKFDEATGTFTISGEGAMYDYEMQSSPWFNNFNIRQVIINDGITHIGNNFFRYSRSLTSIEIPNSVTTIGDGAFALCADLTSIEIPNSVTTIGEQAFGWCSGLKNITIPNSVTTIGDNAFYSCTGLTSVTIGNSVTTIGNSAFYYCSSLASIEIPNSVTSIGAFAFYYCNSLGSVTMGNCVTTIEERAFCYCTGLTSIEIPNSVTTIGDYAFNNCRSLTSITSLIPAETLLVPRSNAFDGVDKENCTLYVPAGAKETYATTEGWNEFTNIVEIIENPFELTVSAAKYATLYLDYNAIIPEGVEVYTANAVDGNRLMMQQVTGVLPANTGVIVRAEQGTYAFEQSFENTEEIENNLFRGSVEDEYITPENGYKYYVLSMKDGIVGMYADALTGGTFKNNANKAYLMLSTRIGIYDEEVDTEDPGMQLSNSYYFDFSGTTAIEPVINEVEDNIYYDLSGRRVENPTQGIYIVNGKKVLVK